MTKGPERVLLMGTPNTGKSTLFNQVTPGGSRVGNFAGTTVERVEGLWRLSDERYITLVDLPGMFSLATRSPEERIALDALLGVGMERVDAVVVVLDGPRLHRSLYLVLQLLELRVPVVLAVNLMDEARLDDRTPDTATMGEVFGVPVVGTVARTGEGMVALAHALEGVLDSPSSATPGPPHRFGAVLDAEAEQVGAALPPALVAEASPDRRRALGRWALLSLLDEQPSGDDLPAVIVHDIMVRGREDGRDIVTEVVGCRYAWIDAYAHRFVGPGLTDAVGTWTRRIDWLSLHPIAGPPLFFLIMCAIFMALFSWSDPAIGLIEGGFSFLGEGATRAFSIAIDAVPAAAGPLTILGDFVVSGLIGGVGAVLVFLPQIALLFFFLALLEDCGYLARASHLMDRVLRAAGLPGKAFVPLLSGFACAVPAILATRTMARFRDRLLTMLVLPLTSCSARLPVYTLVIAALFPAVVTVAGVDLPARPLALLGMYLFSTLVTVLAAVVLGRLLLSQEPAADVIELPPYRMPHPRTVWRTVVARSTDFVREAGKVILWATIALWALLYFPHHEPEAFLTPTVVAEATARGADLDTVVGELALKASYGGQIGQFLEPAIRPLGFDWKMGVGLVGAFAAREVFVSTMGVVYGLGNEQDEESLTLRERIRQERRPDGSRVYTPMVGASLMVFFALAMQCLSTLAVLVKETGGWRWPVFVCVYMTALAYVSALVVYQGGLLLGFE